MVIKSSLSLFSRHNKLNSLSLSSHGSFSFWKKVHLELCCIISIFYSWNDNQTMRYEIFFPANWAVISCPIQSKHLPFSDTLCIFEPSSARFLKPPFLWLNSLNSFKVVRSVMFSSRLFSFILCGFSPVVQNFLQIQWSKMNKIFQFKLSQLQIKWTYYFIYLDNILLKASKYCAWLLDSHTTVLIDTQDGYQHP